MPHSLARVIRVAVLIATVLLLPVIPASATPAWTPVSPLHVARFAAGAATALDGKIYVFGGAMIDPADSSQFIALHTAEVYNPATHAWTVLPAMPTARFALGVAAAPNGKIYAIGGNLNTSAYASAVEVYDPVAGSWSTARSMPTTRTDLAATTGPDGRIYAIGGYLGPGRGVTAVVERYDPASNTWSTAAPLLLARSDLAATLGPDGKIYAIGGSTYSTTYPHNVESYSVTTNTWTPRAPLPTGREGLGAATGRDGRIYAVGGDDGTNSLPTVEVYSPTSNSWVPGTNLPVPTSAPSVVATGGDIYDIGGVVNSNSPAGGRETASVYRFSPGTATVARIGNLRFVRHGSTLHVSWHLTRAVNVAGFNLYAGQHRLSAHTIPIHTGSEYRWSGPLRFKDSLNLHVLLRDSRVISIPASH